MTLKQNRGLYVVLAIILVMGITVYLSNMQSPSQQRKVQMAIATWPGFAIGFVAQEQGYFGDLDIEFVTMDDSSARHAAFQSGKIDVMISSADVFVQERAQGINGTVFLVTDESAGGDGIVVQPRIDHPTDLRGSRIAYARATPSHYLLYRVLKQSGLTPSDITPVVVEDPGHAGQAFIGGTVDAAVTWEPLLTQVRESGKGRVLITTKEMPGTIVDVLVASKSLTKDANILESIIRGWLKGVQYAKENSEEAAIIMARGLNIPSEEAKGMMAGLKLADTARNKHFLCQATNNQPALSEVLKDAGKFWHSQGIIQDIPDVDSMLSSTLCNLLKDAKN